MSQMNFNTFDLNLVRVFLALWDQRSVTAAADRLNLTQPAVSHALKRLREQFDDPLFTRIGKGMEPTPAARRLYIPFKSCHDTLRETMTVHGSFDPQKSARVFTVAMSDISESYVLPRLLAPLLTHAPGVRIRSVQLEAEEIEAKLRSGQVDMAFGFLPDLSPPEFESMLLLDDRFVCIVRDGHPCSETHLTPHSLLTLDFVEVAVNATGYQTVRAVLEQHGIFRTIRAQIEHFSVIPEIVRSTDLAAIYPASVATRLVESREFRTMEMPEIFPPIDVRTHYHSNFRSDAGILWLNSLMKGLF
ncbi:LysR family transcriptional regulator [Pseudooceanicola sp. CBS1P-1]|uniref:LysR family transcriptional regulator n=1 Tax=Pseudooceanicola albus TaxID=2692189 RepID=A0A6L7G1U9_9RHOB|nr:MULTISPECIES: LysR family transcriptional regulator [Pseudooceanicola]MBT9383552.1 LysR family transcriptional regulator [Pseudooceanicola endophyticus]MXN17407.1 LysR family transcriptional regulator [Pseudooceanicola albus]